MNDKQHDIKTTEGKLVWEKDSKRFLRYRVAMSDINIVGTLYFPKDVENLPDRLILNRLEE